jgi:hypothetical protein
MIRFSSLMREHRNPYKGAPLRPWVRLLLVSTDGATQEVEALADTGNPCALIVGQALLRQFNVGLVPGMNTNFGALDGGWLRVQIPELAFDEDLVAYGSDAVLQAVQSSHADFSGLAGLPLLRMLEFGEDRDIFWLRSPSRPAS